MYDSNRIREGEKEQRYYEPSKVTSVISYSLHSITLALIFDQRNELHTKQHSHKFKNLSRLKSTSQKLSNLQSSSFMILEQDLRYIYQQKKKRKKNKKKRV